jgi:Leucine-rich repeat (LRR) protein
MVGCELKNFLQCLPSMTILESIDLGANQLTSLPYNIAKLTNLRSLYMGGNHFH